MTLSFLRKQESRRSPPPPHPPGQSPWIPLWERGTRKNAEGLRPSAGPAGLRRGCRVADPTHGDALIACQVRSGDLTLTHLTVSIPAELVLLAPFHQRLSTIFSLNSRPSIAWLRDVLLPCLPTDASPGAGIYNAAGDSATRELVEPTARVEMGLNKRDVGGIR